MKNRQKKAHINHLKLVEINKKNDWKNIVPFKMALNVQLGKMKDINDGGN